MSESIERQKSEHVTLSTHVLNLGTGMPQRGLAVSLLNEDGDFLAKGRSLSIIEGDLIAILDCGAYGFTMSSNYNSRPKAAEILIADKTDFCIRDREKISDLFSLENVRST